MNTDDFHLIGEISSRDIHIDLQNRQASVSYKSWSGREIVIDIQISQSIQEITDKVREDIKEDLTKKYKQIELIDIKQYSEQNNAGNIYYVKAIKYEELIKSLGHAVQQTIENYPDLKPDQKGKLQSLSDLLSPFADPAIRNYDEKYLKHVRKVYSDLFIPGLREAIEIAEKDKDSRFAEAVYDICGHFYSSIDLNLVLEKTVEFFDGKSATASQSADSTMTTISKVKDYVSKMKKAPRKEKAALFGSAYKSTREGLFFYDTNRACNPPHVIDTYTNKRGNETKSVKNLAFGTPHAGSTIAPEFKGFLRHYDRTKQTHLYISNQNYHPDTFAKREYDRTVGLIGLEKEEKSLFLMVLSKDSDFYHQKNQPKTESAILFKKQLIKSVFGPEVLNTITPYDPHKSPNALKESGSYISPKIMDRYNTLHPEGSLDKISQKMIAQIHRKLFANKDPLTVEDKKIFIEVFHTLLTQHVIAELNVDSFNITCKDAIDRGAASSARLFAYHAVAQGQSDSKMMEHGLKVKFSRSYFVRKREIIVERANRALEDIQFVLVKSKEYSSLQELFAARLMLVFPKALAGEEE